VRKPNYNLRTRVEDAGEFLICDPSPWSGTEVARQWAMNGAIGQFRAIACLHSMQLEDILQSYKLIIWTVVR